MTGKAYYITTLADWQRHAARFGNSHFIVLDAPELGGLGGQGFRPDINDRRAAPSSVEAPDFSPAKTTSAERLSLAQPYPQHVVEPPSGRGAVIAEDSQVRILVLVEADEGVHLSLEDDSAFEPLPHPLAQKPIPDSAQAALAPHGVAPGATTFDAAEVLARIHPLLKHRVF
jgi:hypothetical protein